MQCVFAQLTLLTCLMLGCMELSSGARLGEEACTLRKKTAHRSHKRKAPPRFHARKATEKNDYYYDENPIEQPQTLVETASGCDDGETPLGDIIPEATKDEDVQPKASASLIKSDKQKSKDRKKKKRKKLKKQGARPLSVSTKLKIDVAVKTAVDDAKEASKKARRKGAVAEVISASEIGRRAGKAAAQIAEAAGASADTIEDQRRKASDTAEERAKLEAAIKTAMPSKQKAMTNVVKVQMALLKAQSLAAKAEANEKMANAQLESLAVNEAEDVMDARLTKVREDDYAKVKSGEASVDGEVQALNKELELLVSKGLAKEALRGKSPMEAAKAGAKSLTKAAAAAKVSPAEAGRIAADAAADIGYQTDAVGAAASSAAESVALAEGKSRKKVKAAAEAAGKAAKSSLQEARDAESDGGDDDESGDKNDLVEKEWKDKSGDDAEKPLQSVPIDEDSADDATAETIYEHASDEDSKI